MPNPKTPGDAFFESYCALNGYIAKLEPPWRDLLGIEADTQPDYLIERGGDRAIVEVKHFTTTRQKERLMAAPGRAMYFGGRELYGTLQRSVRDGAEQLRPFASVGLPLVVVVTDPLSSDVSLHSDDVVSALFGEVKLLVDPDSDRTELVFSEDGAVLTRTAGGELLNLLPHLSAVVAAYGLTDFERVDVYDLARCPGFTGTPLHRSMFDGENDHWFGFVGDLTFARTR